MKKLLLTAMTPICAALAAETPKAVPANDFLNSIGAVSSVSRRGENLGNTIENLKYTGIRWLRVGYEDNAPPSDFIAAHKATGVRFSFGLLSGGRDLDRLVREGRELAEAGALVAIEGANEPNNFGPIVYQGETGGLLEHSWLPVAKMHRDLYAKVKEDPVLKNYPVWSATDVGAMTDNCGMQFLTIPKGVKTLMPGGTKFADALNCHNYTAHPSWPGLHDNQTWIASLPNSQNRCNGPWSNFTRTWRKGFAGIPEKDLASLPRVTTETGIRTGEHGVTDEVQARMYLNLYLSQFKQGWSHTAIYLFKTRGDELDHETLAFYKRDYSPKQAAHYLHNFTTILADDPAKPTPNLAKLNYSIHNQPATTHDLLLQKTNGDLYLVLWGERFKSGGSDDIRVRLSKHFKRVYVYDPTTGVEPVQILPNAITVPLSLTDHPVILRLTNNEE
ncbi:MAG: glycosyl hydrolase [Kiritimatiellaeota bacterium]|nr:glycosyl hydrolase [Kiritimatiellota bacterium]